MVKRKAVEVYPSKTVEVYPKPVKGPWEDDSKYPGDLFYDPPKKDQTVQQWNYNQFPWNGPRLVSPLYPYPGVPDPNYYDYRMPLSHHYLQNPWFVYGYDAYSRGYTQTYNEKYELVNVPIPGWPYANFPLDQSPIVMENGSPKWSPTNANYEYNSDMYKVDYSTNTPGSYYPNPSAPTPEPPPAPTPEPPAPVPVPPGFIPPGVIHPPGWGPTQPQPPAPPSEPTPPPSGVPDPNLWPDPPAPPPPVNPPGPTPSPTPAPSPPEPTPPTPTPAPPAPEPPAPQPPTPQPPAPQPPAPQPPAPQPPAPQPPAPEPPAPEPGPRILPEVPDEPENRDLGPSIPEPTDNLPDFGLPLICFKEVVRGNEVVGCFDERGTRFEYRGPTHVNSTTTLFGVWTGPAPYANDVPVNVKGWPEMGTSALDSFSLLYTILTYEFGHHSEEINNEYIARIQAALRRGVITVSRNVAEFDTAMRIIKSFRRTGHIFDAVNAFGQTEYSTRLGGVPYSSRWMDANAQMTFPMFEFLPEEQDQLRQAFELNPTRIIKTTDELLAFLESADLRTSYPYIWLSQRRFKTMQADRALEHVLQTIQPLQKSSTILPSWTQDDEKTMEYNQIQPEIRTQALLNDLVANVLEALL